MNNNIVREDDFHDTGDVLNPYDLLKVTMPTGDSHHWVLKNMNDEPLPPISEIQCQIVFIEPTPSGADAYRGSAGVGHKILYSAKFGDTEDPEIVCQSKDAITGKYTPLNDAAHCDAIEQDGVPTGTCRDCPHSQWKGNNPPACQSRRNVMILLKDEYLPRRLDLPSTQHKSFSNYLTMVLRARRLNPKNVITSLRLGPKPNGKRGNLIIFSMIGMADDADVERAQIAENMLSTGIQVAKPNQTEQSSSAHHHPGEEDFPVYESENPNPNH
jgi:hypothetical protein